MILWVEIWCNLWWDVPTKWCICHGPNNFLTFTPVRFCQWLLFFRFWYWGPSFVMRKCFVWLVLDSAIWLSNLITVFLLKDVLSFFRYTEPSIQHLACILYKIISWYPFIPLIYTRVIRNLFPIYIDVCISTFSVEVHNS